MKIILDESFPQELRLLIEGGHTVATTWFSGLVRAEKRSAVGLLTAFEQATESRTEGSGADEGVRPTIELCGELLTQDTCAPPLFDRPVAGVWMPFVTR